MNPVIHFEMPYEDADRVSEFYKTTFGWDMKQLGVDMSNYIIAGTTESTDTGPTEPGTINGGFAQKTKDYHAPSVVISVDNIEEAIEKIKSAGGSNVSEILNIPGIGKYAMFTDTEGNRVSVLQGAGS